ncbi:uncharacterized protein LOC104896339 isoform X2 [Beta vulgaris subsp. vulgaris]|uniref:uncharacterized protein LOC104896339 isoform X2 n=3 Tax=Beta vulgaris subsp. vulgaris TaxID=3555 RepID=UPI0020371FE0|nr:uncharacterized protein LOC104896339 isoform X2 [Beta vulgaris subsp. vulgaris]
MRRWAILLHTITSDKCGRIQVMRIMLDATVPAYFVGQLRRAGDKLREKVKLYQLRISIIRRGLMIECRICATLSNICREEKPADGAAQILGDGLEEYVHDLAHRNQSTLTLSDNLLEADMLMETEIMSVDHASNFSAANSCCESNVLDDRLEHNKKAMVISLIEQANAQGSRLDSDIMQPENIGSTITVDQTDVTDLSNESQNMMVFGQGNDDSVRCSNASDGWSAYWDSFYMRYFYYNAKTQESTWYPPPGMEGLASDDVSCTFSGSEVTETNTGPLFDQGEAQSDRCEFASAGLSFASTMHSDSTCDRNLKESLVLDRHCTIEHSYLWENGKELEASDDMCNGHLNSEDSDLFGSPCLNADKSSNSCLSSRICTVEEAGDAAYISDMHLDERDTKADDIQMQDTPAGTKKKTRRKNRRKNSFNHSEDHDIQWVEESYNIDIMKYWRQRYYLFSRFDDGIEMDDEGWFSVTPEAIARHQASRSGGGIIIDCFTGVGGNAIQFAKTSQHVIAIDIDSKKIGYAHHNASIYGVADNIDFITGDSLSLVSKLKADTVFMSPPWGGPDYVKVKSYDINMLQPYDGKLLFNTFKEIASTIIMFLPRNVNIEQLAELCLSANPPWSLEVEKNFLNEGLKAVTAYFRRTSVSI